MKAVKGGAAVILVAAFALSVVWLGGSSAAAQGKPSYGCGLGFDFHLTTTQAAELPKSQKAIDDGLITKDELIAIYRAKWDHNGNDMVCVKDPRGLENAQRPLAQYIYNFVDDNASSPNGS